MHRTTLSVLALFLFTLSLAATASAVPLFVEMKIREPLAALTATGTGGEDQLVVPELGGGKGKSNGKGSGANSGGENRGNGGKSSDPFSKANLKSLTLWISADGKVWKHLDGQVVDLSADKITARVDSKGDTSLGAAMSTFGLPAIDPNGGGSSSYYIGVSTSSTSIWDGAYTAQLVSWDYFSANGAEISIPEPASWPLFTVGVLGLGLVLATRKSR